MRITYSRVASSFACMILAPNKADIACRNNSSPIDNNAESERNRGANPPRCQGFPLARPRHLPSFLHCVSLRSVQPGRPSPDSAIDSAPPFPGWPPFRVHARMHPNFFNTRRTPTTRHCDSQLDHNVSGRMLSRCCCGFLVAVLASFSKISVSGLATVLRSLPHPANL